MIGEVKPSGSVPYAIEDRTGRAIELIGGDRIVGALGRRAATLELVGDWTAVGEDLELETLTAAGVLGRTTSAAVMSQPIAKLRYLGHVQRDGAKVTMAGEAPVPSGKPLTAPVVLLIGTSMEAGKTVAGRAVVRCLEKRGLRVVGTKLTGVGRYRDVLSLGDVGAVGIRDFVDAGLPSSAVSRERYLEALAILLSQIADLEPDVVVAEAGASPLEPYNGDAAIETLGELTKCTILCASDPYAVTGVMDGVRQQAGPDLGPRGEHQRRDRARRQAHRPAR